jgi:TonB family protein
MVIKYSILLTFLVALSITANAQEKTDGIKAGIVNGKAIVLPKPEYPPEAKEFCAGGKVEIEVLISEKGDVIEAKAISGDEFLHNASVEAVKKAKFAPAGHPMPFKLRGIVVYNFDSLAKCLNVGVVNKRALKVPKPSVNLSPPKTEAIIAVQIVIDMNGKVTAARAFSGHPLVRSVFEKAACQAEFSPTFVNGPPVRVRALLVYKLKPDGSIDTNIEKDNIDVIKTPVNLVEPLPPFCNCQFGGDSSVLVEAKIDEQGNVTEAKALSGHPILRKSSENAALKSKFLPTSIKAKILISYNFEALGKEGRTAKFKDFAIKSVMIEK